MAVKAFVPSSWRDHSRVDEKPISPALKALRVNLSRVIVHSGLTEPQFAKRAKVDQKTVWRVLRGDNEPSLEILSKLAKACGMEPWQMLTPELEPNNPPLLAAQSERLKLVLDNIRNTKEAIEGVLRDQGNTRPGDLED